MLLVLSVQQCMNVHVYPLTCLTLHVALGKVQWIWLGCRQLQYRMVLTFSLTTCLINTHWCVRPSAGSWNKESWLMENSFASCFCFISSGAEVMTAGDTIYYLNCLAKVPSEQHSIHSIFNVRGIIKCLKQCMLGIGGHFYLLCRLKVLQSRCTHSEMEVFTNVQK